MKINSGFTLVALVGLIVSTVQALDIPLGGPTTTGKGGTNIGYVDMDLIFELYPQTKFAKDDYNKQLKARREELAKKEAELEDIKNRIAILEQTLKGMNEPSGVAEPDESLANQEAVDPAKKEEPLPKNPEELQKLKAELEGKKADYEDARKRINEELSSFQKKQSQMILGKLYQALKDLAEEEQIQIVVDKTSILYGIGDIDLTEKLRNKVRGY